MTAADAYLPLSLSEVLASMKGDEFLVTVASTYDKEFRDEGKPPRLALVIVTEEYPRNPFFPNVGKGGSVSLLYQLLGDDQVEWVGRRLLLRRVRGVFNPTTKTTADKFRVVGVEVKRGKGYR